MSNTDRKVFNWLHLTDFHQGMSSQDWMWPQVEHAFFVDLEQMYEACGPWDFILFSGDMTQRGSREEFDRFDKNLGRLRDQMATYGGGGKAPQVLAVPGNHDLVRPADPALLRNWQSDADLRESFWQDPAHPGRQIIEAAFQNYQEWWKPYASELLDYRHGLLPGDFSATIEKDGAKLGVVGLNTAFLQLTDAKYKGDLALHTRQFQSACGGHGPDWAKRHHSCLLMTHHPPSWLDRDSTKHLKTEIRAHGIFCAHFCGHLHKAKQKRGGRVGDDPRLLYQGRSMFGLEFVDKKRKRLHGYAAYRMEMNDAEGQLRSWPRQAKRVGKDMKLIADYKLNVEESSLSTRPVSFELLNAYRITGPAASGKGITDVPMPNAPYKPQFCVQRKSLMARAIASLEGDVPPVFSGPRGYGKSWLIEDTRRELASTSEYDIVSFEIDLLDEQARSSTRNLLVSFAAQIGFLRPEIKEAFERLGGEKLAATSLMQSRLKASRQPLVLIIDGADAILKFPPGKDFLYLLRAWLNKKGEQPDPWAKFKILMSVEKTVGKLSEELLNSPFNIAQEIPITAWSGKHLDELAAYFGIRLSESDKQDFHRLFGNIPVLSAIALYENYFNGWAWNEVVKSQPLKSYLSRVDHELRQSGLFPAFVEVKERPKLPWRQEEHEPLQRLGVIVRDGNNNTARLSAEIFSEIR